MKTNVIQAGKPATGHHFIGREDEVKQISQLLRLGQSVVLIAPRRFGKTSLVLEILKRNKLKSCYTAYIDVFSSPTIELLSTQIIEAILKNHRLDRVFIKSRKSALAMMKNLKLKTVIEDFEFMLGFSESKPNEWGLLQDSIKFIDQFASRHGVSIICAFDEFGDVGKLDGDKIVKLFRSEIQTQQNASYLFSGSYESVMNSMFIKKNSPFFRFARIIHLDFIEKETFIKYFSKILPGYDILPDRLFLEEVMDFTGGHPYYSQLALQTIIIHKLLTGTPPDLGSLITVMLDSEHGYLIKTWEDIASNRENILVLLAVAEYGRDLYKRLQKHNINVYRGLSSLINSGIILKLMDNTFMLSDPLFAVWIHRNISKGIEPPN
jgi:hypothetical protein